MQITSPPLLHSTLCIKSSFNPSTWFLLLCLGILQAVQEVDVRRRDWENIGNAPILCEGETMRHFSTLQKDGNRQPRRVGWQCTQNV